MKTLYTNFPYLLRGLEELEAECMTLRHLRIYTVVYRKESITKAANILHMAQPAVSLAIKELEEHYDLCLFDRIGKRIYVTEQGKWFYDYALHIISLFDEMENDIRTWQDKGTLRIGSSVTIGNFILPQLVGEFQKEYPNIEVQVLIQNTDTILKKTMDNQLDLALVEGKNTYAQLFAQPLMKDPLCFICGRDHELAMNKEVSLKDLEKYPMIFREKGSAVREIVEETMGYYQINSKVTWESMSTQAIIHAVVENLGISVLPYLLVKENLEKGEVVQIQVKDFLLTREFSIVYHEKKYLTKAARAFIEQVKEKLSQEFRK